MKIFISDKMSEEGLNYFKNTEGFEVTYNPEITMEELGKALCDYDGLVIRSRTRVSREMLEHPGRLRVIGRAGAGVDNVDVTAATEKGIIVMNTPGGNTVSTAEHAISMMFSLARRIPFADATMKAGKWAKKSITGVEMDGKTLGVIGLGKIGQVVANRMRAFGMEILGFDPFLSKEAADKLGVELTDVDTICKKADLITLHCPLNDDTRNLINAERLAMMKPSMLLINCARGGIVDEDALLEALKAGTIAGAAFDVFSQEPLAEDHPFRTLDNMVITPHVAASTGEAQERVAEGIALQFNDLWTKDIVRNAVNAPSVDSKTYIRMKPVFDLCERLGRFAGQYVTNAIRAMEITYSGTLAEYPMPPMTSSLIKGFLDPRVEVSVNAVNAMLIAEQRGFSVKESCEIQAGEYAGLLTITITDDSEAKTVLRGTFNHLKQPRLVSVNEWSVDVYPTGGMVVLENEDVPGIIGAVCTCLGENNINIAEMSWGRFKMGGTALTVLNTDEPVGPEVCDALRNLKHVLKVQAMVI